MTIKISGFKAVKYHYNNEHSDENNTASTYHVQQRPRNVFWSNLRMNSDCVLHGYIIDI